MSEQETIRAAMEREGQIPPITFEAWLAELRSEFCKRASMTQAEAEGYGEPESWRGYFDDGYSPSKTVTEDMSYWDDGE
jgi:hypothetical protein